MAERLITLTTDFGLQDALVGIMKGVILEINPKAVIIDLCHQISPYNLEEGSFVISHAYHYFPKGSIHVVVIDPGVGSERKAILIEADQHYFVAPDNGVLSGVLDRQQPIRIYHLNQKQFFRPEISQTFHGRDIFAPVSAWLSTGLPASVFGPELHDCVKLPHSLPHHLGPGIFTFNILYIDHFGNLITNIEEAFFNQALSLAQDKRFSIEIGGQVITHLASRYGSLREGERVGVILGSSGHLEIFAPLARSDLILGLSQGGQGKITFY